MEQIEDVIEPFVLAATADSNRCHGALFQGKTAGEDGQLLQNHIW